MYLVTMKDGTTQRVKRFDGGGVGFVLGRSIGGYEVAAYDPDNNFVEIQQALIESVTDEETGDPFTDFGNPYFPHPYHTVES